ncbi:SRPBCC family protein [Actinoplanes sp. NPDC048988]|uniref:SRPBCC family protein n=1 Tax=Actinoplanes sp. NPDC048988 TaxID=3363901 RepID=UPI0037209D72
MIAVVDGAVAVGSDGRWTFDAEGRSWMATVRAEVVVDLPPEQVWEAVADVGAVHRRLLPGRVRDARIEGDARILTMPDGWQVREVIVAVDHGLRRLAYAVADGQRMPLTYHHASFQVFDEEGRGRLVWVTDVLPHAMAAVVRGVVERGLAEIKQTLESGTRQPLGGPSEGPGSGAGQSSGIDA